MPKPKSRRLPRIRTLRPWRELNERDVRRLEGAKKAGKLVKLGDNMFRLTDGTILKLYPRKDVWRVREVK